MRQNKAGKCRHAGLPLVQWMAEGVKLRERAIGIGTMVG